jgi:hypothetical protein
MERIEQRRFGVRIVIAAVLAGLSGPLSACMDGDVVGSSTVTGSYVLRTVNGSPLPYTIAGTGTDKTEILDDAITLFQGGGYSESGHTRVTVNGQVTNTTNTESGSYSLFGTSVSLASSGAPHSRVATIQANTMTIVEAGRTSVFRK